MSGGFTRLGKIISVIIELATMIKAPINSASLAPAVKARLDRSIIICDSCGIGILCAAMCAAWILPFIASSAWAGSWAGHCTALISVKYVAFPIVPNTATPKAAPTCLVVLFIAEPTPDWLTGIAPITEFVAGLIVKPIPSELRHMAMTIFP